LSLPSFLSRDLLALRALLLAINTSLVYPLFALSRKFFWLFFIHGYAGV